MINHEDLAEYLREAGYTTGMRRATSQPQGEENVHIAMHDEIGVALKW